jgi:hypothetical protein
MLLHALNESGRVVKMVSGGISLFGLLIAARTREEILDPTRREYRRQMLDPLVKWET